MGGVVKESTQKILDFYNYYLNENGVPPTYEEILTAGVAKTYGQVRNIISRYNLVIRDVRFQRNKPRKTRTDRQKIFNLRATGMTMEKIAKACGVTVMTVSRTLRGLYNEKPAPEQNFKKVIAQGMDYPEFWAISVSCGNDSVALVQYLHEEYPDMRKVVIHCDTGWQSTAWPERVEQFKAYVERLGYEFVVVQAEKLMEELILEKMNFPKDVQGGARWCTSKLKEVPFEWYLREIDPMKRATICVGVRRSESSKRRNYPEYSDSGGREKWAALYLHTDEMRDALIRRAGFDILPHRSKECSPCIYASKDDLIKLGEDEIRRVERLEKATNQVMFNPNNKMGATGIREMIKWANSPRGKYEPPSGCDGGYCGG